MTSGNAKIAHTTLAITIFRIDKPFITIGTTKSVGSIANGARATRFARKCMKSVGNLQVSQDGVNSGNDDIAIHKTTVETTYPNHPRFLLQAHAIVADAKVDATTKPTQNNTALKIASLRHLSCPAPDAHP